MNKFIKNLMGRKISGFTRPTEISEETLIYNGYFNSREDKRPI